MDKFNLNFISLGALVTSVFTLTVGVYLISIPKRSKATTALAFGFLFMTGLTVAYSIAASIYHPLAAYHRWLSVWGVLPAVVYLGQFFFHFPCDRGLKTGRSLLFAQLAITAAVCAYWTVHTYGSGAIVFRHDGQYFDFDDERVSAFIAQVILLFIAVILASGTWRVIIARGKDRLSISAIVVGFAVLVILPGVGNYLIRINVWTRELFHVVFDLFMLFGWFAVAMIYLNITRDRTSFMAKISGVGYATFLIVLIVVSYYSLGEREESYRALRRAFIPEMISDSSYRPGDLEYFTSAKPPGTRPAVMFSRLGTVVPESGVTEGDRSFIAADPSNHGHFMAFTYIDRNSGTLYEAGYSFIGYRRFIHRSAVVFAYILGAVFLTALFGYRLLLGGTLVSPLYALIRGHRKISEGNLDVSVPVKTEDEIGYLSKSFNGMVDSIRKATFETEMAERALRSAEEKFRGLVEQSLTGIYIIQNERIFYANPKFAEIFGYTQDEMLNLDSVLEVIAEKDRGVVRDNLRKRETMEVSYINYMFTGKRKDGGLIDIEVFGASMDFEGRPATIGTLLDITERKRAQEETSRIRSFLKNILDSMPSILATVDGVGTVLHWNFQAEESTGVPSGEAIGKPLTEVLPIMSGHAGMIGKAVAEKRSQKIEKLVSGEGASRRYYTIVIYPLMAADLQGAVIRVDDITEQVRIEEIMVQTEKMMTIGGLSAGMAHEINNPVSAVLMGSQNLTRRFDAGNEKNDGAARECGTDIGAIRAYLEKRGIFSLIGTIHDAGMRAAEIVQDMLAFSRGSTHEMKPVDLSGLIDKSIELASHEYDLKHKYDFRKIEIVRDYNPSMGKVVCVETEIQQVMINLLKNAAQAFSLKVWENSKPRIDVRIINEKGWALVVIEDNGPGMDENTRKKIFEPFFTTKTPGIGTGLGLFVSYFIVHKNHRGSLEVESTPGVGTKFMIRLPSDS